MANESLDLDAIRAGWALYPLTTDVYRLCGEIDRLRAENELNKERVLLLDQQREVFFRLSERQRPVVEAAVALNSALRSKVPQHGSSIHFAREALFAAVDAYNQQAQTGGKE